MTLLRYIGDWIYAIWITFFPGKDAVIYEEDQ